MERLDWVSFKGHLLPRTVGWPIPRLPSPLLPAYSRMGETMKVGVQLGTGQGSGGSGVRSWAEAGDRWELPMCSLLCPVTPQSCQG